MILAVVGPTGVGKTRMSEYLSEKYDAIVINCDAVQVYKKLDIGSAKVKAEEKSSKKHYLFDIKDIKEDYSVADYQKDIRKILDENKDKNIVIVGGTGLYLSAGIYNYEFSQTVKDESLEAFTNEKLYSLAIKKDPNCDIHQNNRVRLINFLSKEKISTKANELLYDVKIIGLEAPREVLYKKIDLRVENMFEEGLLEEVKSLYSYKENSRVLNSAIGYKELIEFLDNKKTLKEATEEIKQNSRRYAKRQFTWFKNKMNVKWFEVNYENFDETIKEVENYIEN